jgi:hypothetical protein
MGEARPNSNDAGAGARLACLEEIMIKRFGFEVGLACIGCSMLLSRNQVREVRPLAYEEGFPFPYNNFVYAVEISWPSQDQPIVQHTQPGTSALPKDTSAIVFRMANPASGYNDRTRIENEVAALSLAREALQPTLSRLIPEVYGWASAKNGQGWIVQQLMPGESLTESFGLLSVDDKTSVLGQIADVLACLQRYELPISINAFGGVGFDESGRYCSTEMSVEKAGPFMKYEDLLRARITTKLEKANGDPWVRGWRENGVRARLDKFVTHGLAATLPENINTKKVLVHADLSKCFLVRRLLK